MATETNAYDWLAQQFEFEYCAECGGGERDHDVLGVLGHPFGHCKHPLPDDLTDKQIRTELSARHKRADVGLPVVATDFGTPDEGAPYVERWPACQVCQDNHQAPDPADYLMPLSTDGGETVTWRPVCRRHAAGWWDGSDWHGPVFNLRKV